MESVYMLIMCNHLLLATPPVDNKKVFSFSFFFSLCMAVLKYVLTCKKVSDIDTLVVHQ